jgi:hypothetical protein
VYHHLVEDSGVTLDTIAGTSLHPVAPFIWKEVTSAGAGFLDILRMLSVLEDANIETASALPAFKARPAIISRYLSASKLTPGVLAAYQPRSHSKLMRDWWQFLQQRQQVDPNVLRKAGAKGFSLIIVGLFVWHLKLSRKNNTELFKWWSLVADVRRVLRDLVSGVPGFVPAVFHEIPESCRPINDVPPPATFEEMEARREEDRLNGWEEEEEVEPTARALRVARRAKRPIDNVDEVVIQGDGHGR